MIRAQFPVYPDVDRSVATAVAAVLFVLFGILPPILGVPPALTLLSLLVASLSFLALRRATRATLELGADGVLYRARFKTRFVRWDEIQGIEQQGTDLVLTLPTGEPPLKFSCAYAINLDATESERHTRLLALARAAKSRSGQVETELETSRRLARRGRPREEWLAACRVEEGFRAQPLAEDDLWRVVEDPAAPPTARAGAAVALARNGEGERTRLRIAADACAEPRLRVVLERAATGEEVPLGALDAVTDAKRA